MRRVTALLVGSALIAACGGSSDENATPPDATETEATQPATEVDGQPDEDVSDGVIDTEGEAPTDEPVDTTTTTDPAEPTETTVLPTTAPEPDPTTTTSEPDAGSEAFADVGQGEYPVGVQTITITDLARDRSLTVDVTFPLADGETGELQRYTFVTGDYYESPRAVAATPEQISPDGPFPLVVYTHGSGGLRYIHSDYTETLASHGYVVVAADHTGNTAIDRFLESESDRATIAYDRPRDVQVLIDQMTNPENPETSGFVGSVNPESIAVTGHSLGGYGTLAVGGGMSNEAGSIEPDDRVDALIPLAPAIGDGDPATSLLVAEQLANIDVPILVMVGTNDTSTPPSPNVDRTVAETSSKTVYRVELVDAAHQSFTDVCDYLDFFPTLPNPTPEVVGIIEVFAEEGCSAGDMDIDRVKEITNTFAVSFLDSVFDGTEMITDANTALPDDVLFSVK